MGYHLNTCDLEASDCGKTFDPVTRRYITEKEELRVWDEKQRLADIEW